MANIKNYLTQIEKTRRGEDVRDAIINTLEVMDEEGTNAQSLNHIRSNEFVLKDDYYSNLFFDQIPIKNSIKAVTSDGLYNAMTQINVVLDNINGEEVKEYDDSTPVESITINSEDNRNELIIGKEGYETLQLTADILPVDATNKKIRWTTSAIRGGIYEYRSIYDVIVTQTGLVKYIGKSLVANSRYYVTITATSKSNTAIKHNFIVYIQNIKLVTSIEITTNKGNNPIIGIGDFGLKAVIAKMYPGDYGSEDTGIEYSTASDKRVEWLSSNRNILDIDEDGNVITNEVSEITTVDIYCKSKDGSNTTSNQITVTIDPSIEPEETIEPIEGEPNA